MRHIGTQASRHAPSAVIVIMTPNRCSGVKFRIIAITRRRPTKQSPWEYALGRGIASPSARNDGGAEANGCRSDIKNYAFG